MNLFLFIFLTWTAHVNGFQHSRLQIMTPNNGPGNVPPSQGNIYEFAMFPPSTNNNLAPNTDSSSIVPNVVDKSLDVNTSPKISETVSYGETVIKIEFPSTINIFVNVTSNGQPMNPSVVVTAESSTAGNTVVNTDSVINDETISIDATTESGTKILVDLSTTEVIIQMPTEENPSTDHNVEELVTTTTVVETSTVATNPVDVLTISTIEDSGTLTSSTETITVDATTLSTDYVIDVATDANAVASSTNDTAPTTMITVEILTENNTEEINTTPVPAPILNESSTDSTTHIQININLSDNTLNGNFGSTTTQPSNTENLEQLKDKMIYKEKCDEYYTYNRSVRKATVQVFIVGGTSSLPKEFPHMAALGFGNGTKKEWLCGGSLISENFVITAAHCLSSKIMGDVQVVRLGTTVLNSPSFDYADYNVIKRIAHPNYNNDEQYNDIALLQLDHAVKFTQYISPICLQSSNQTEQVLIATGWGKTEPTGDVSPELQKVELEYFPNQECQDSYSIVSKQELPKGIMAETQICAGSRTEKKDTCQGDSGGPLQMEDDGRMYLVGITSFGIGCGQPGRPGVYTTVAYYIPWIENIVWGTGRWT